MRRAGLVAGVFAVGCHAATPAAPRPATPHARASRLEAPFDVEARRAGVGQPMPEPAPPPATSPIRDVVGVSFYVDADKSVADPAAQAANLAALRPLRDFVRDVVQLADGWLVSRPANPRYATYALDALGRWAAADALLGTVNPQGEFEREWTLGSLALAYLKVRDADGLDAGKRAAIEAWLARLAAAVIPYYERPGRESGANNHAYWAGMAVGAAGIAANDRRLFDWGLARARIGIGQIRPDGLLPLELKRRALALHYHLFALAPLVMLAEMAEANGIPLYREGDRAIGRLAERVVAGLGDPSPFAVEAGAPQTIHLPPQKADLAWAEAYAARFPDPRLGAWIHAARPLVDVRLGGDMTAAFGGR